MNLKNTLAELVAIDSVSSRSNAEIVNYLTRRCEAMHFSTQRFSYTDNSGNEKINLIAIAGTNFSNETEVELALVGHTDTVPYDLNWTEATTLTERTGKLYGRGACDTKGFIAAAITAIEEVDLARLHRPLAFVFTADEEIGLVGAKHLAQLKPLRVRYSIVGEPTSLRPMRAGKGYSLAEVILRGREAHSAYPSLGASAVLRAARLISRIEAIGERLKADQHPAFDPPYTTLNVGLINGGTAKNVIAGECRFTLEWRTIPAQPSNYFLDLLHEAIDEERRQDNTFECEVNANRMDGGFETASESRLTALLEKATGLAAGTVAFGTEAAPMKALGSEAIVLGPGDIREAHRTGEFVPVAELERCVEVIKTAALELCG